MSVPGPVHCFGARGYATGPGIAQAVQTIRFCLISECGMQVLACSSSFLGRVVGFEISDACLPTQSPRNARYCTGYAATLSLCDVGSILWPPHHSHVSSRYHALSLSLPSPPLFNATTSISS
eukprot:3770679-Rhodomonas_salina.2